MLKLVKEHFDFLLDDQRFTIINESLSDNEFGVVYQSSNIQMRLVSYHGEIYVYVSPTFDLENEASLFNIVNFIHRDSNTEIEPNFAKSYSKQAKFIAYTLKENMSKLEVFFCEKNFGERSKALSEYMTRKYPELFERWEP